MANIKNKHEFESTRSEWEGHGFLGWRNHIKPNFKKLSENNRLFKSLEKSLNEIIKYRKSNKRPKQLCILKNKLKK